MNACRALNESTQLVRLNEAVTVSIPKELGITEPAKHGAIMISLIVLQ